MDTTLHKLPEPDWRIHSNRVTTNHGKICRVHKLSHDTLLVVIKCDDGAAPINATAGQYAALAAPEVRKPRVYSFAKALENEAENEYSFIIRLLPNGEFSGWLAADNRIGAPITISGPLGNFTLDHTNDPILCVAGGSGMSAILSILQHAANVSVARDCLFLYGARTQRDLYCLDELEGIKAAWNVKHTFRFVPVLSEEPDESDWTGATGFVTEHLQQHHMGSLDVGHTRAYFCGPPPMIDAGVAILIATGLPRHHIYYDKFEDMSSPAPVIDNALCVLCDECLLVRPLENCIVEIAQLGANGSGYRRIDPAHTSGLYYNTLYIDEDECIRCFACVDACPVNAISPQFRKTPWVLRQLVN